MFIIFEFILLIRFIFHLIIIDFLDINSHNVLILLNFLFFIYIYIVFITIQKTSFYCLNVSESHSVVSDSLWVSTCLYSPWNSPGQNNGVGTPFSRGSSQPRDQTQVSHIAGHFSTSWATSEALYCLSSHLIAIFCTCLFCELGSWIASLCLECEYSTSQNWEVQCNLCAKEPIFIDKPAKWNTSESIYS